MVEVLIKSVGASCHADGPGRSVEIMDKLAIVFEITYRRLILLNSSLFVYVYAEQLKTKLEPQGSLM